MKLVPVVLVVVLLSSGISCKQLVNPVDCSDIYQQDKSLPSGVYTIYPLGERSAVQVYCDMKTKGGRWTVFQKREDGTVNFYRPWDQYKMGFGNADGEHWLGLDSLHYLTRRQKHELLVEMEAFGDGKTVSASYSMFSVGSECDGYRLKVSGFKNGGAGDSLLYHNNMKFSTFDKNNDANSGKCSRTYLGGYWYNSCYASNPNGIYRWIYDTTISYIGVTWRTYKGINYSLKAISMKIRPVL